MKLTKHFKLKTHSIVVGLNEHLKLEYEAIFPENIFNIVSVFIPVERESVPTVADRFPNAWFPGR